MAKHDVGVRPCKESRRGVRVYGVEPEGRGGRVAGRSRRARSSIDPVSVADGAGAVRRRVDAVDLCRYLDEIVILDDATILAGLRFAAERMKQVLSRPAPPRSPPSSTAEFQIREASASASSRPVAMSRSHGSTSWSRPAVEATRPTWSCSLAEPEEVMHTGPGVLKLASGRSIGWEARGPADGRVVGCSTASRSRDIRGFEQDLLERFGFACSRSTAPDTATRIASASTAGMSRPTCWRSRTPSVASSRSAVSMGAVYALTLARWPRAHQPHRSR